MLRYTHSNKYNKTINIFLALTTKNNSLPFSYVFPIKNTTTILKKLYTFLTIKKITKKALFQYKMHHLTKFLQFSNLPLPT